MSLKAQKFALQTAQREGDRYLLRAPRNKTLKNEHQRKITFNWESHVPGHSEESLDGDSKDRVEGASQADLRYWQQDGNKHGEDLQNSR